MCHTVWHASTPVLSLSRSYEAVALHPKETSVHATASTVCVCATRYCICNSGHGQPCICTPCACTRYRALEVHPYEVEGGHLEDSQDSWEGDRGVPRGTAVQLLRLSIVHCERS